MFSVHSISGDRFLVVGQSGSGKSVATAFIASHLRQPTLVLDAKGEELYQRAFSGAFVLTESEDATKRWLRHADGSKLRAIIYQPSFTEVQTFDAIATDLFYTVLHHGDFAVVVDEAYTLSDNKGLIACLTRGRGLGVSTIVASQRPRWITRFAFTEASHIFAFYLQDIEDKKRVTEFSSIKVEDIETLGPYEFVYWRPGTLAHRGRFYTDIPERAIQKHVWI